MQNFKENNNKKKKKKKNTPLNFGLKSNKPLDFLISK